MENVPELLRKNTPIDSHLHETAISQDISGHVTGCRHAKTGVRAPRLIFAILSSPGTT
jgi:hypothetical protein